MKMEDGVFVSYLMLHICGCGKLCRKKNTPITLLVLELDKQLVFCVSGFHFMYDLFFFLLHFHYAGSVGQMFRAQVRWLLGCHCHSQAGECIPVILTSIQYHIA